MVAADITGPSRGFSPGTLSIQLFILMVYFQSWVVVVDIPGPVLRRSVFNEVSMLFRFMFARIQHCRPLLYFSFSFLFEFSVFILFAFFVDESMGGTRWPLAVEAFVQPVHLFAALLLQRSDSRLELAHRRSYNVDDGWHRIFAHLAGFALYVLYETAHRAELAVFDLGVDAIAGSDGRTVEDLLRVNG